MARAPIPPTDTRLQFSGHETFPLRYAWLKKVYDAVEATSHETNNKGVFLDEAAIATFGVGKNMVRSMRYWALAAGIIEDASGGNFKGPFRTTPIARALLGANGWDRFLEDPASLWWVHWQLASTPNVTTTIYYAFNRYNAATFNREQLVRGIRRYCEEAKFDDLSESTLSNDVACFVRTYAARVESEEDALDSLMSELGLIQPIGRQDGFLVSRGPKPSLPDAIFFYGLVEFARWRQDARTLSVEALAYEPGSPGRVFLLSEDALLERLGNIDGVSDGRITWSETAGMRQLIFHQSPVDMDRLKILASAFEGQRRQRRAA